MVNNLDWLGKLSLIDFLRDTGKHFTIPYMLAKDSVQVRLERGLSFTEFSYMLLQAYDFAHLHRTMGVELQMGGADQWGNITAGLELIRRTSGAGEAEADPVHGLAYKLLLSPSGTKFGKSETGESVWLDPARTSPYDFYQHWLRTDDRDVGTYLRWFTELGREEIEALEADARASARGAGGPAGAGARHHDPDPWRSGGGAGRRRFGGTLRRAVDRGPGGPASLYDSTGGFAFDAATLAAGTAVLLADAGLVDSRGEARRMIAGGGVTINGTRVTDAAFVPEPIAGEWLDVRIGKRRRAIGRRQA